MTGRLGPGWAGLAMTYALDFTQALLVMLPCLLITSGWFECMQKWR
jgi:hypothetical protein